MYKRHGESYDDYKKRVIDPISDSFCAAKWLNATIWLGSGTTASCHHPPAHRIDVDELKANPSAIHNTAHKKLTRAQMLKGERPPECEYCWKIEDIKRDNISDRVFKTVVYHDVDIARISEIDPNTDVNPRRLEIAFDRTCNFACSYCNASFSTTWAKDIKNNGIYKGFQSDGGKAFQHDGRWAQPYKDDETNPYIEAFWRWFPTLSKDLQELRITGGEPLMSTDVWKLFDYFKEHGSGDMLFSINSNLGAKDDLIDKLIEQSHHVNKFELYTSCEAMGVQAEYIRDGLDFDKWTQNIDKIISGANINMLHVMMTINSLCLYSITDFMDLMLSWKQMYGGGYPCWSVNLLRFPSFMSPLALPDHLKDERRNHLIQWYNSRETNPLMNEGEKVSVKRLIDYLEVVDMPHSQETLEKPKLWRDMKTFYHQYDQRRGKNIVSAFPPILTDWLTSIELNSMVGETVDGDSTKAKSFGA